jgi:hypothetical protein
MPVVVKVVGVEQLSAAYEVGGQTIAVPGEVVITGPQPELDRVFQVAATVSVAGATTTVQKTQPLQTLDANAEIVEGVTIDPQEALVTTFVRRRIDARDVGVRAVTTGSPPDGYWLNGLRVEPSSVTIQGNPNVLADMESFVDTLPVDLSQAIGETIVEAPLDIPPEVQALDGNGNAIGTVTVTAQIAPRSGDLLVERSVVLINDRGTLTVTLEPPDVTLLLSGPLPILNEIEQSPELVSVVINALDLVPDQSREVIPDVIAPDGIVAQFVEKSVLVTAVP